MKILIVNTVEFGTNGITSVIMNYYRNMDKSKMKIDFVAINEINNNYRTEFKKNGSSVFEIPRKKNILVLKYMFLLFKILKKNKYDIIHIHGNSSLMAIETITSFIANIPVRIVHSHNTTCDYLKLHKLLLPIFNYTYTHAFSCGDEAGKWLFGKKKYEIINNGIELEKFIFNKLVREECRKKLNLENKIVIGHIGNFVVQKNHEFLINLFTTLTEKNKDYVLLLIGDGPLLNTIKEKVIKLNLQNNVIFLGQVTDIPYYLHAMDLLLLPSHHEGLPVVLIEAQAMGLDCLVSNNVSSKSKLTPLIEFLPINDTKIWVNQIINYSNRTLLINKNQYHENIKLSGYNIKENSEKLINLYSQYLNK